MNIVIIGGGAAGFFAAITAAEADPEARVTILEQGRSVLQKVRVSGGGRCNVTHACFDPQLLVRYYPRGSRELLGPFRRFGPADTVEWFSGRDVALKTENDGRMFPVTDDSQTIVDCLLHAARQAGVSVRTGTRFTGLEQCPAGWRVLVAHDEPILANRVLVATGSSVPVWNILSKLGLAIVSPVPSLFTFNTKDIRLRQLAGVSVPGVSLRIAALKLASQGPLLVTHWGLSGPAVLQLSAWGARELHELDYRFSLQVNWLNDRTTTETLELLKTIKQEQAKKQMHTRSPFDLPQRLWERLVETAGVPAGLRWADSSNAMLQQLGETLTNSVFPIHGKSTFKEEFVTAGGVDLKELNFKTFECKRFPGLFLAGETLDIDAITGGFNFQAAWTGGWIAGNALVEPG